MSIVIMYWGNICVQSPGQLLNFVDNREGKNAFVNKFILKESDILSLLVDVSYRK